MDKFHLNIYIQKEIQAWKSFNTYIGNENVGSWWRRPGDPIYKIDWRWDLRICNRFVFFRWNDLQEVFLFNLYSLYHEDFRHHCSWVYHSNFLHCHCHCLCLCLCVRLLFHKICIMFKTISRNRNQIRAMWFNEVKEENFSP